MKQTLFLIANFMLQRETPPPPYIHISVCVFCVDTTLGQRLKVNIDVTFHAITCAEINVDAMDVAGDNQVVKVEG